ncbi:MAG: BRCT domain-containing protein, partial [Verrucomicrobiota bacterium]
GPTVAASVLDYFASPLGQGLLQRISDLGIEPTSERFAPTPPSEASEDLPFVGKTFVITGTLSAPRSEIKRRIEDLGGKVSGSVSSKTSFLLAGEGGGSKRDKADALGIPVVEEADLQSLAASGGEDQ